MLAWRGCAYLNYESRIRYPQGDDGGGIEAVEKEVDLGELLFDQQPSILPRHTIYIPNGTRLLEIERKIFRKGRLYDPYPVSLNQLTAEQAVEVLKVQILAGDHKGTNVWVLNQGLGRALAMP